MELITFKDIANCTGLNEIKAGVALSVPPIHEGNRHFRAFCISELLISRIEDEKYMWGDVAHICTWNQNEVLVEVRFPSCIHTFPFLIPAAVITGHKDIIVNHVRRLEKELSDQLRTWSKLSKKGSIRVEVNELIKQMNYSKKKHYNW